MREPNILALSRKNAKVNFYKYYLSDGNISVIARLQAGVTGRVEIELKIVMIKLKVF